MSIFDIFARTVSGEEAAALGYVNAGTDKRIGGSLGRILGQAQSNLSFKEATPPFRQVEQVGNILLETAVAPNGRQHISVAIPRGNGRWATFRFGWRFDGQWGDDKVIGFNPRPDVIGGYIADVVLKLDATQTFIAGREQG